MGQASQVRGLIAGSAMTQEVMMRSTVFRLTATVMFLALGACSHFTNSEKTESGSGSRAQLSKQFPAVRINVKPMSDIEADTRKAIGTDLAKDIAPVIGKSGTDFEREALLTFYDSLNEQRHLVRAMLEREKVPASRDFLETTRFELDSRYDKVGSLLNRRYFTH